MLLGSNDRLSRLCQVARGYVCLEGWRDQSCTESRSLAVSCSRFLAPLSLSLFLCLSLSISVSPVSLSLSLSVSVSSPRPHPTDELQTLHMRIMSFRSGVQSAARAWGDQGLKNLEVSFGLVFPRSCRLLRIFTVCLSIPRQVAHVIPKGARVSLHATSRSIVLRDIGDACGIHDATGIHRRRRAATVELQDYQACQGHAKLLGRQLSRCTYNYVHGTESDHENIRQQPCLVTLHFKTACSGRSGLY